MKDTITAYYQENGLLLNAEYAKLNNIPDGYTIWTEAEFWKILGGNAEYMIPRLELMIDAEKNHNN